MIKHNWDFHGCLTGDCPHEKQSECDAALKDHWKEAFDCAAKALAFYADHTNWERIEGHTQWASNLKVQDCALLNCGGGRARLALQAVN
jgi:hypothetical protein